MSAPATTVVQLSSLRGEHVTWRLPADGTSEPRHMAGFPHKTFHVTPPTARVMIEGANDPQEDTPWAELLDATGFPIRAGGIYRVEAHTLWLRVTNRGDDPIVVSLLAYREG